MYLSAGILEQAIADYKALLRGKVLYDGQRDIIPETTETLERFFLSDFGQLLSNGNGDYIIRRCKKEVAEEQAGGKIKKIKKRYKAYNVYAQNPNDSKIKRILCIETGEIFNGLSNASTKYGVCVSALSRAAHKDVKCAGFHWKYIDK